MGRACSKYEGEEQCIQGFGGNIGGKESTWKTKVTWEDNIKMDTQEMGLGGGHMDWIDFVQNRNRWRAVVNVVMNLLVP